MLVAGNTVTKETSVVDTGSAASLKVVFSGTPPAYVGQPVTDQLAALSGRTLSFTCRVWCNTANCARLNLQVNGSTANYSAYHTGSSAWQTLSVTAAMPTLTNLTAYIQFDAACTAYLDNACLVVGSQPANYVPLHPADDLARCLRYYEVVGADGSLVYAAYCGAGLAGACYVRYRAQKPVTPTVTKVGTWAVTNCAQPVIGSNGPDGAQIYALASATAQMQFNTNNATTYMSSEANP
jgi:hypothetical protein